MQYAIHYHRKVIYSEITEVGKRIYVEPPNPSYRIEPIIFLPKCGAARAVPVSPAPTAMLSNQNSNSVNSLRNNTVHTLVCT